MRKKWKRKLIVYFREVIIRFKAFRGFIVLFVLLISIGTTTMMIRMKQTFLFSLYQSLALLFFASEIPFPTHDVVLEILWIFYPITGLILLADGITNLGTILKFSEHTSPRYNMEMAKLMNNHIIIVGIGNIGLKLLNKLIDEESEDIVVIDKDEDSTKDDIIEEYRRRQQIVLIRGDGSKTQALQDAGVKSAKAIFVVTNDDLLNLKVALQAKNQNNKIKAIVRMFDLEFGDQVKDKLGIDVVLSTSSISIPYFISAMK